LKSVNEYLNTKPGTILPEFFNCIQCNIFKAPIDIYNGIIGPNNDIIAFNNGSIGVNNGIIGPNNDIIAFNNGSIGVNNGITGPNNDIIAFNNGISGVCNKITRVLKKLSEVLFVRTCNGGRSG
jgi:hypothetical protein